MKQILMTITALMCAVVMAYGDQVLLKDETVLDGTVIGMNKRSLTIETKIGKVIVNRSKIRYIALGEPLPYEARRSEESIPAGLRAVVLKVMDFDYYGSMSALGRYIKVNNSVAELAVLFSESDYKEALFRLMDSSWSKDYKYLESYLYPKNFLRNENGVLTIKPYIDQEQFKKEISFKVVPGLADPKGISFESAVKPGCYIRQRGSSLYVGSGSDEQFRKDATFYQGYK